MPLRLLFCLLLFYAQGLAAQGPLTVTSEHTDLTCFGVNDGTITLQASGGQPPYSGAVGEDGSLKVAGLSVGTYIYTVRDAAGDAVEVMVTIGQPKALLIETTSITGETLEKGGTVSVSAKGGTKPYTYLWSNGDETSATDGLEAGDYVVTVTDDNGCEIDLTVTIQDQVPPLSFNIIRGPISCNGLSDGTIAIDVDGGAPPYISDDFSENGKLLVQNVSAGTYTYRVEDSRGRDSTVTVIMEDPDPVTATAAELKHLDAEGPGRIVAQGQGGTGDFSYAWADGPTGATRENLEAGDYTVTVTDANGCTGSQTFTIEDRIEELNIAVVIGESQGVSCFNGSDGVVSLATTGGVPPYSGDVDAAGKATLTGLAAGTYTYTVTDSRNTQVTKEVILVNPEELIVADGGSTDVTEDGLGRATVTVQGGSEPYRFSWEGLDETTATVSDLTAGEYTVTVTDFNGCTSTQSFTIEDNTPDFVVTATAADISCSGSADGMITLNVTGGLAPYSVDVDEDGNAFIMDLAAGTYTYTITDSREESREVTTTIDRPAELVVSNGGQTNVTPDGPGSATVTATGGTPDYTYLWSNEATTAQITNLTPGTYTVTVSDASGCTATTSFNILDQTAELAAEVTDLTNVDCFGNSTGSVTLTATDGVPPYTIEGGEFDDNGRVSLGGLGAGDYTYTITDARSATATVNVTIAEPTAALAATPASQTDVSADGLGGATVGVTGGTDPYTFLWSNGAETATVTDLTAGTYTVTVTDFNGCTTTQSFTVEDTAPEFTAAVTATEVGCFGSSDGTATITAAGGVAPYAVEGDRRFNEAGEAMVTDLAAGTYTYTITDARGESREVSATVGSPEELVAGNGGQTNVTPDGPGSATVSATGGTPEYSYRWSTDETTAEITGLTPGDYTVTVTDGNGCTATEMFSILDQTADLAVTATEVFNSCFGAANGSVTLTATGGVTPFTIEGGTFNDMGMVTFTGLAAGDYTYTVTDARSVSVAVNVTITEAASALVATAGESTDITTDGPGTASVTATGGTEPYTYSWNNEATTPAIEVTMMGTYTVTVTDANRCTAVQSFEIGDRTPPPTVTATVTDSQCGNEGTGSVQLTATGGTAPYRTDVQADGDSLHVNLTPGSYTFTVTDSRDSVRTVEVTVGGPEPIVASVEVDEQTEESAGSASISVTGGVGAYTFVWSDESLEGNSIEEVKAGNYSVTITDEIGCSIVEDIFVPDSIALPTFAIASFTNPTCSDSNDGSIRFTIAGGVAPYGGDINAAGDSLYTNLGDGIQQFTITDARDSSITLSFSLNAPDPIEIEASELIDERSAQPGSIVLDVTGGTPEYTYDWGTDTLSGTTLTDLSAGTYTVTVTDSRGCTSLDSFIVQDLTSNRTFTLTEAEIYPTIVDDRMTVSLGANQVIETLTILSVDGQVIHRRAYPNQRQVVLTGSALPQQAGAYFLYIEANGGVAGTYRFVVQ